MDIMMTRFVVGVDGSAAAAAAMRWAGQLAAVADAEIVAVNAFQIPYSEVRPETHDRFVAEREMVLPAWTSSAVDEGASVRTILRQGDPRDVLLREADNEGADLVVLGRTGRSGGPGFLHLGSVVEHAAHHIQRPLAVVPSAVPQPIRRIVVGVDGSKESLVALDWCAELASLTEAEVVVVVVADPDRTWNASTTPGQWRQDVEAQLENWVAPLAAVDVIPDRVIQSDIHPADGLLGAASAWDGDVLVIGTRGTGSTFGVRIGGVAMKVLHRASLPLVLVPPSSPR